MKGVEVHIDKIVNPEALAYHIERGYVTVRTHPEYGYRIYNYTDKCQYENVWNKTTMTCRGLITDHGGNVIARGMRKFFNYGQEWAPEFSVDDNVLVLDKVDGSLGIVYPTPDGGWEVATRGSFTSDQAIHATAALTDAQKSVAEDAYKVGETVLCEIVYPENRIVLDYGDTDELVMLGIVQRETGGFSTGVTEWALRWGRCAQSLGLMSFGQALGLEPRPNAEGVVLIRPHDRAMLKIKQDDYLRLHRAVFGLTARSLWEDVKNDADLDEFFESLPDELQAWAQKTLDDLFEQAEIIMSGVTQRFESLVNTLDYLHGVDSWTRGDFAYLAKQDETPNLMFLLYDGKDLFNSVWGMLRPDAHIKPYGGKGDE